MKIPHYLLDYSSIEFEKIYADFLIIGTGVAGLYSAVHAHAHGKVMIVTKEKPEDSSTEHAQGGIAAVFDETEDSVDLHLKDTLMAGAGLCNKTAVELLVQEGPDRVRDLIKLGTNFDRYEDRIALTREGAHSRRRILHAGGDATGEEIRSSLNRVVNQLGIPIHEKTFILDAIIHEGRCYGVLAYCHFYKKFIAYLAPVTILATGGLGQMYLTTSNPDVTTGDGMAIAYRAGAELMDMEFIQFHPTTLFIPGQPGFLVSEAVRGEGAVLRNAKGEQFMPEYHELADLAPRDVVARAIKTEMQKDDKHHVWLDITHQDPEFVKKRFPNIYNTCLKFGIDMTKDWIPVAPAAHYMMGGIRTDLTGATRVPGLYACGEVACNGVHGANRLASNSLLEGLVFGYRIVESAVAEKNKVQVDLSQIPVAVTEAKTEQVLPKDLRYQLQKLMTEQVGIVRTAESLTTALQQLEEWQVYLNHHCDNMEDWETQNMLLIAYVVIQSALIRKESRGAHYRLDYPEPNVNYRGRHFIFSPEPQRSDSIELES